MTTDRAVELKLKDLTDKLITFCDANGLPHKPADRLALADDITDQQRRWLIAFVDEWDAVAEYDRVRT